MTSTSSKSSIRRILAYADRDFRRFYFRTVLLRAVIGLIDLIALGIFGLLGSLAVETDASFSKRKNELLIRLMENLLGQEISRLKMISAVTLIGLGLFGAKSVASLAINSRLHRRLADLEVSLGTTTYSQLLSQQLDTLKMVESQRIAQALSAGVSAASIRTLSFVATIVGELTLMLVVGVVFIWIEPQMTVALTLYFGLFAAVLYRLVARPSERFGFHVGDVTIKSTRTIQESLRTIRELRMLGKIDHPVRHYRTTKADAASAHARLLTLAYVPRQVIDTAIIFGIAIASAILFKKYEPSDAIQAIAFLLVAGTRLAPSLLALQGAQSSLRASKGEAVHFLNLIESVSLRELSIHPSRQFACRENPQPDVLVKASNLSYIYPEASKPAINDVSFSISRGSFTAIVGPSGSGKTTLADIILGLLCPIGNIELNGLLPKLYVEHFPGRVAYIPQDSTLVTGTLAANVALGCDHEEIDESQVVRSLEAVGLWTFAQSLRNGIWTSTGEYGSLLSGGQKQRVGLARALYTNPSLLVLDESTSALDIDSERVILDLIEQLRGEVTVIMIAHKLTSVVNADQILVLVDGCLVGDGRADDLATSVPFFASAFND